MAASASSVVVFQVPKIVCTAAVAALNFNDLRSSGAAVRQAMLLVGCDEGGLTGFQFADLGRGMRGLPTVDLDLADRQISYYQCSTWLGLAPIRATRGK